MESSQILDSGGLSLRIFWVYSHSDFLLNERGWEVGEDVRGDERSLETSWELCHRNQHRVVVLISTSMH
jgi:hypothetical protein